MHTIWRYNCGTFLKEMHASQEIMYSLPLMEAYASVSYLWHLEKVSLCLSRLCAVHASLTHDTLDLAT